MKKMMMLFAVAAFAWTANAQTPCKKKACNKHNTEHCVQKAGACCGQPDCVCPEGAQHCTSECKPCDPKNVNCKEACKDNCKDTCKDNCKEECKNKCPKVSKENSGACCKNSKQACQTACKK